MYNRESQYLNQSNDDKMNGIYSTLFRLIGVVLQILFIGLYSVINYSIAYDVIRLHYFVYDSIMIVVVLSIVYGYCSLNTLFNYLASCAISPGNTSEFPQLNLELYSAAVNLSTCQKCRKIKPPRSHHCSICRQCVFKMDHHCPWINNCVGHFNMRYFLLFLFYTTWTLFLGSLGYLHITLNSDFDEYLKQITSFASIVSVLSYSLTFAMSLFAAFNWGLALKGYTQIEYWNKKIPTPQDQQKQVTFEHSTVLDNLNEIFGTKNIFKMFLPSFRRQPEDGINWKNCRTNIFQQSLQDISNNLNGTEQLGNNRSNSHGNQKKKHFYQLQQHDNDNFQLTEDNL